MLPEKYDYEYYQKLLLKLLRMPDIERSQIIVIKCMRRMYSNNTLCILERKKPIFKAVTRLCFYATVGLKLLPLLIFKHSTSSFSIIFADIYYSFWFTLTVIDVVIVGRCCCHFSPFTLAFFFLFFSPLLFLILFP